MDSNIILSSSGKTLSTVISNNFIDKYMADANGGYVKVYVYLLRLNQDPTRNVSIPLIAEELDETEKDIRTALKYWADKGVLSLTKKGNVITGITVKDLDEYQQDEYPQDDSEDFIGITSVSVPERSTVTVDKSYIYDESKRPNYTPKVMNDFKATLPDYRELLNEIEFIYGSPLTQNDMKEVTFLYEQLNFPTDLIRYLYDYCINTRHKNPRERGFIKYIDTTAIEWDKAGNNTLEKAMQEVENFSSAVIAVKTALSLTDKLKPAQVGIIKKWSKEYGFSDEIIVAACNRSVLQAKGSNPSLNYIDSMLTGWYEQKVTTLSDVDKLEANHQKSKEAAKKASDTASYGNASRQKTPRFDYSQRNYSEEELKQQEQKLLRRSLINK